MEPTTTSSDRIRLDLIISFVDDEGSYTLTREHVQMLRRFLRTACRVSEAVQGES